MTPRCLLGWFAAVCWALAGCSESADSPPDSIVDTYSSDRVGFVGLSHVMPVDKFTFEVGGTGVRTRLASCGKDASEHPFTWEIRDGSVVISKPGDQFGFQTNADEWRFVRVAACTADGLHEIQLQEVRRGEMIRDRRLFRADVCLARYEDASCPEGYECDDCEMVSCDDEPQLPCEE